MAIRMMITKEKFDQKPQGAYVIENYSGHDGPLYMQETHQGLVLELREVNGRDDSDFYANVWNEQEQRVERIDYATTRGWTYPNNAEVDATDEVKQKANAYYKAEAQKAHDKAMAEEAKKPLPGKWVKVIKGRKLPLGTTAKVFWFGQDSYKRQSQGSRYNSLNFLSIMGYELYFAHYFRVGVELDNGQKVFLSAENVEVVQVGE